mmetsp:Transcript_34547/g.107324  ORF Transcript_34547/g.107324 Transcript_34547/m.107324 type:complete len:294 (-) Transcript_34547:301-1182(-)
MLRSPQHSVDLTSSSPLVVCVDLVGDLLPLVHLHAVVDVVLPEVEHHLGPLGDGVLPPLGRVLLHLLDLGDDVGREDGACGTPDEAPTTLPVVHLYGAREGARAQDDAVLQALPGHGDAARERHVVALVASPLGLHDPKLHRNLPHKRGLSPAGVDLRQVNAHLFWHWLGDRVPVVHGEPTKAPLGREELQLPRVAEVLPADKLLLLGVELVLHRDEAAARQGHPLRLQRPDAGALVLHLGDAQLDFHALHELRKAVLCMEALPVHVHCVGRHDVLLREVNEAETAPLPVDLH